MEQHVSFFDQPTVSLAETSLMSPAPSDDSHDHEGSPSPHSDEKKPVKKRRSWGQELPTPKTNLPPRKRAKTEDEKEQRRIERVLRNRQAAQSSRERKRQETEKLEAELVVINTENRALRAQLLTGAEERFSMQQQLEQMRELLRQNGFTLPSPPTSPIIKFKETSIKQEVEELPPLFQSEHTVDPRASLSSAGTPRSSNSVEPETSSGASASDLAQHPAVPVQSEVSIDFSGSRRDSVISAATPATSVSDGTFDSLFDAGNSPLPTTSFFEEGYAAEGADNDADHVSFDNLVNLDTNVPTQTDDFDFGGDDHYTHFPFDFTSSNDTIVDFSHQSAATSSHLQPCTGASS